MRKQESGGGDKGNILVVRRGSVFRSLQSLPTVSCSEKAAVFASRVMKALPASAFLVVFVLLMRVPLLAQSAAPPATATTTTTTTTSTAGSPADTTAEWLAQNYTKYEYRIPMRDGVKLFTRVYAPKDDSQTW